MSDWLARIKGMKQVDRDRLDGEEEDEDAKDEK